LEALVEGDPDIEVEFHIGHVVLVEVVSNAASILLHHVRVGAPSSGCGPHLPPSPPSHQVANNRKTATNQNELYD